MSSNNQKSWLSIDNQIQLLKNRNLTIDNDSYARNILNRISYYRLISYRFPFCDKTEEIIKLKTSKIKEIYNL